MPKVSVILTSFNHEKFLREAINSVLNQTYQDFELIIWDDASSDNSWHLIKQYADARIKAFRNDTRKRGIWGVNKAISEIASGRYIAIHHSDDVWEPDKLEKQVAFLNAHNDIGAVFTHALVIKEDGQSLADRNHFYFNIFDQPNRNRHEWLRFFFCHGNVLCHPSVLVRKSCYEKCGLYRYGLAQICDFDLWIRLCSKYEIHILPEKLVRFRIHDDEANTSGSRIDTRIRVRYEFYKLLSNYRNLTSFDELTKIFPFASKYFRKEETDLDFALAMICLEEKPFPFTVLFVQDLLFEIISDQERAKRIKRLYDFDYKNFIDLTAKNDVFSLEEITSLNTAIGKRDEILSNLKQALAEHEAAEKKLWSDLAERERQIAGLNQALAEHEAAEKKLWSDLAEREGQIAGLSQAVAERKKQIAAINKAIGGFNQSLAEHEAAEKKLWSDLAERERQIAVLNQAMAEHEAAEKKLWSDLAEREGQIAGLNQALAEHEAAEKKLWSDLAVHKEQIAGLSQDVAERERQIAGLNQSLAELRKSISWRVTAPFRFIARQLLRLKMLFL